jgi:thioredoxin-related protein
MSMKPVVNRIAGEHAGNLQLLQVNAQDRLGAIVSARFKLRVTPTFVLFDAQGEEILRTIGMIDPNDLSRALERAP